VINDATGMDNRGRPKNPPDFVYADGKLTKNDKNQFFSMPLVILLVMVGLWSIQV